MSQSTLAELRTELDAQDSNVVSDAEVDALTDEFDPKRRASGLSGQLQGL